MQELKADVKRVFIKGLLKVGENPKLMPFHPIKSKQGKTNMQLLKAVKEDQPQLSE